MYHSFKVQNEPIDADQYQQLFRELSKIYNVEKMVFYDAVKNSGIDPVGYAKQQRFHERLKKAVPIVKIKTIPLRYVRSISKEDVVRVAKSVDLQATLKDKLYLFLKKLGVIKFSKEKGLDVLIVVDLLDAHKSEKFDRMILFSGDSDYVPAVELVQRQGAKVINLHAYSGSSSQLRQACHEHILMEIDAGKVSLKTYSPRP